MIKYKKKRGKSTRLTLPKKLDPVNDQYSIGYMKSGWYVYDDWGEAGGPYKTKRAAAIRAQELYNITTE